MLEYIIVLSISVSIVFSFAAIIAGIVYYINTKRQKEQDELNSLIQSDYDTSQLFSTKRVDPSDDINECEDSDKSCAREIKSFTNKCTLRTQDDGNLVIHDIGKNVKWSSGTFGKGTGPYRTVVEEDGNFALYDANDEKLWESGKRNTFVNKKTGKIDQALPPYRFTFKGERPCNGSIMDNKNHILWSSLQSQLENKKLRLEGSGCLSDNNKNVLIDDKCDQRWSLTEAGQLKNLTTGRCLDGNARSDMAGYLKILPIRSGNLEKDMKDEEKEELKKQLEAFGKGDLRDVDDIINRIKSEKNIHMSDCQDENQFQRWDYFEGQLRHQAPLNDIPPPLLSGSCLSVLDKREQFQKEEKKKDNMLNVEIRNFGTYGCNQPGRNIWNFEN